MGVFSVKIIVNRNKVSKTSEIFPGFEIMSGLIELTKMDTRKILINISSIETVEAAPDTVVVLCSGRKLLVKETFEEICNLVNSQAVQ